VGHIGCDCPTNKGGKERTLACAVEREDEIDASMIASLIVDVPEDVVLLAIRKDTELIYAT